MTALDIRPDERPSPTLTVVADPDTPMIDHKAARAAVRDLLVALGQEVDGAELAETPRRVVAAFEELLTPATFRLTTFANDERYDELVIARDIPVRS
ncbi:MAG: GTP cyclohydrolase I, partial [Candidatus Limnocylindria bacterium]